MSSVQQNYDLVIKPKYGLLNLNWQEIVEYRELLFLLALREIKIRYKQTIMGIGWAVLQPLFTMVIFTLIFSGFANMPSDGIPYPIFSYSGLLLWIYFSNALTLSSNSFVGNAALISKVYIPRIFLPIAPCLAGILDYIIAFSILIILMIYYVFIPNIMVIFLPLVIFITMLLAVGLGFWLSSLCVKYRDIKFVLPFFIQLLMFISPVIYPSNMIGGSLKWIIDINPLTGLINAHRACLLGHFPIDWYGFILSSIITVIIFISGLIFLKRTEKEFADLV